jgi:hypothetical protein
MIMSKICDSIKEIILSIQVEQGVTLSVPLCDGYYAKVFMAAGQPQPNTAPMICADVYHIDKYVHSAMRMANGSIMCPIYKHGY